MTTLREWCKANPKDADAAIKLADRVAKELASAPIERTVLVMAALFNRVQGRLGDALTIETLMTEILKARDLISNRAEQ